MTFVFKILFPILLFANPKFEKINLLIKEDKLEEAINSLNTINAKELSVVDRSEFHLLKGKCFRYEGGQDSLARKEWQMGLAILGFKSKERNACLLNIELAKLEQRNSPIEASKFANESLALGIKLKDTSVIRNSYWILGNINYYNHTYAKAEEYYIKASSLSKEKLIKAHLLSNTGLTQLELGGNKNAKETFRNVLDLYSEFNASKRNRNSVLLNFTLAKIRLMEFDSVEILLDEVEELIYENDWVEQKLDFYQAKFDYSIHLSNNKELRFLLDTIEHYEHLEFDQKEAAAKEKYESEKKDYQLDLQAAEAKKKARTIIFLGALLGLFGISFFLYFNRMRVKRKLLLVENQLEKQTALTNERTRIAAEMHDDLGGGLTTIKFLSQKVMRKMEDEKEKATVGKIVNNAESLVTNMSEIIWAMNGGFDTLASLVAYSRRYASEYLGDHDIKLDFAIDGDIHKIPMSGEKRRNVFLVIKEALHNTVKYAEASKVTLHFNRGEDLIIKIKDNGKGFVENGNFELGNGLKNMKQRIDKLNGTFKIEGIEGVQIDITVPIESSAPN